MLDYLLAGGITYLLRYFDLPGRKKAGCANVQQRALPNNSLFAAFIRIPF